MKLHNNSFMASVDLETLYNDKIVERITKKLLLNLFSKGNNNAYDIYTGKNNGQVTIEDLTQGMLLFLSEHPNEWYISRTMHRYSTDEVITTLVFFSDNVQKDFFRIVSNTLYSQRTRHDIRKVWIELDGEMVKSDDVTALANHVCIDNVVTMELYNQFVSYLYNTKPKKAGLYVDFINTRLRGFKIRECAKVLNIKETTAFDSAKQLKTLWKNFNK